MELKEMFEDRHLALPLNQSKDPALPPLRRDGESARGCECS